jgi:hypothetical protein
MERSQKHTRRRFKTWQIIVALPLFLLVLLHISGSYKVRKRVQALSDQGYPVTIEELEDSYTIPDGVPNAADIYLAAFTHYREWDKAAMQALHKARSPARTEPLSASARQLVEKFLFDNQKTFSLLHEAASIEHCRYPIDFAQVFDSSDTRLDNIRSCSQLLLLDVLIQCENQDPGKALASIRANLALSRSIDVPLLGCQLTHIGLQSWTCGSIERILNRISLKDEQLLTLSEWIKTPDLGENFKRALRTEQCLGIHTLQAPIRDLTKRAGHGGILLMLVPWKILGFCYRDTLTFIDLMQESIETLDLPDPERLAAFDAVQKSVHQGGRGGMLMREFWPAHTYILDIGIRYVAHLRATHTALAVERYRLAEGRLPQSLNNLVPAYISEIPDDPFNGSPLNYRLLHAGYVVYSVGDDLTDEGGTERGTQGRDARNKPLPCDITFIVER